MFKFALATCLITAVVGFAIMAGDFVLYVYTIKPIVGVGMGMVIIGILAAFGLALWKER